MYQTHPYECHDSFIQVTHISLAILPKQGVYRKISRSVFTSLHLLFILFAWKTHLYECCDSFIRVAHILLHRRHRSGREEGVCSRLNISSFVYMCGRLIHVSAVTHSYEWHTYSYIAGIVAEEKMECVCISKIYMYVYGRLIHMSAFDGFATSQCCGFSEGWHDLPFFRRLAHNSCTQFIKQQNVIAHQAYLFVVGQRLCMLF